MTAPAMAATVGGQAPAGEGAGAEIGGRGLEPQAQRGGGGALSGGGEAGQRSASGPDQQRSITRSLAELDQRLGQMGESGRAGVAGIQVGSIFFDPQGADFTGWINHFKNEVYRNWIVPEAARFGYAGGHVDFEFWVERDGRLTGLRLLKSSGTRSLDRAAQNGLTGSRLLPLPDDYGPDRVRFEVSFSYGEERG
ncbi:MAG TPA: energy transducer TonB [Vicinamibacteria bacterium]|nr:energy transducer TonB [Vicinamibacteria bacterium]